MDIDLRAKADPVVTSLGLVLVAFLIGLGLIRAGGAVLGTVGVPLAERPVLAIALSILLLQGVAFGGISLVYLLFGNIDFSFLNVRVPGVRDLIWVGIGFLSLLTVLGTMSVIYHQLGVEPAQNEIIEIGAIDPTIFLVLIPLSFLLIGPGEELLFRGLIQGLLREQFGAVASIGIASVIFAGAHVIGLSGTGILAHLVVLFMLSIVLGGIYEYSQNLVVPALVHGAYNALIFTFAYVVTVYDLESATIVDSVSLLGV